MIRSVHIENFQGHVDSTLEFTDGVNVIVGDTCSGKTSVLRAIKWVVENRPRGTEFITRTKQQGKRKVFPPCRVTITTDKGRVARVREKGFNGYIIQKAGEDERRFKEVGATVPEEIRDVLNFDAINTQEQLADFFLMMESPGQISKYVSSLLGLEVVDEAARLAKAETNSINREVSGLLGAISADSAAIDELGDLDAVGEKLASLEDLTSQAVALEDQARQIESMVSFISEATTEVGELIRVCDLLDLTEIEESWTHLASVGAMVVGLTQALHNIAHNEDEVQIITDRFDKCEKELADKIEEYKETLLAMDMCPYCGSQVDSDHINEVLVA